MRWTVASLIIVVFLAACGSEGAGTGDPSGTWERLPDAPLSVRENAVAVAVGDHVLVVGGSDAVPCPPLSDCNAPDEPALRDGALFEAATNQWRPIADAPVPIDWAGTAVIGSSVYLWVPETFRSGSREAFLRYQLETDEWAELPVPTDAAASPDDSPDNCCAITGAGGHITAYRSSDEYGEAPDYIFDLATGGWTELPADPLSPTFDRVMVWDGSELILFASTLQGEPANDGWSTGLAAAFNVQSGQWRELPNTGSHVVDTTMIGGKILNPWLGASRGDELYGWTYDVASGELTALPDAPEVPGVGHMSAVGGGEGYFAEDFGWVLDLYSAEWRWIEPRPGTSRGPDGPYVSGVSTAALGESMFTFGGVRWEDHDASEPDWLDEAWLWSP